MAGALEHVRVLEVANVIAGPYAAMLLADLGAEVIKVEPPGTGDLFRAWSRGSYSPAFIAYNRNKRSVTLNLKDPRGVDLFKRLAAEADVIVENLRPGVMDRLGIGYEAIRAINPRLVYCSISGFGDSGPYVDRPAYDGVIQAIGGLMSELTDEERPRPVGPPFSDHLTGIFACQSILAALVRRDHTGHGQRLVAPMIASTMSLLLSPVLRRSMFGELSGPYRRSMNSQTYAFACADGKSLVVHISSHQKFWMGLLRVTGRTDIAEDPRFANRDGRAKHYFEIEAALQERFRTRPRDEWLAELEAADVPCAPVNSIDEALEDPQVRHLGLDATFDWPDEVAEAERAGTMRTVKYPVFFSETPPVDPAAPPVLSRDTEDVLRGLGLSAEEFARLRADGVI